MTRVDDSDGVVRQRLTVYLEETEPLVNYYDGRATFFRINGNLAAGRGHRAGARRAGHVAGAGAPGGAARRRRDVPS